MKKRFSRILALAAFGVMMLGGTAMATTIYYPDTMVEFPGYNTDTREYIGTPVISGMQVTYNDTTLMLETVQIFLTGRQKYDTLFINTNWKGPTDYTDWHSWEYLVRSEDDLGTSYDPYKYYIPIGLYTVASGYTYTLVPSSSLYDIRTGHPEGIVNDSYLNNIDNSFVPTYANDILTYNFAGLSDPDKIYLNGPWFNIAYAPWCANDLTGGGSPVPEPATMLLFGSGLVGLASFGKRQLRKKTQA